MKCFWIFGTGLLCWFASGCAGNSSKALSYRTAHRISAPGLIERQYAQDQASKATVGKIIASSASSPAGSQHGESAAGDLNDEPVIQAASFAAPIDSEAENSPDRPAILHQDGHASIRDQDQENGSPDFESVSRVPLSQELIPVQAWNEASAPTYSLSEIEQQALANNSSLATAQAAVHKANGLRNQVGVRPNPTFGYFGQQLADQGTDQHGLFWEREFVRGDKLRWNRQVLFHTATAQQREWETQQYRVLTDVRVRFYEAIAAQQQLQAARALQATARRGVEIARDRVKAEEGSRIEVLQSQTLLSEITLAVERTEIAYRAAWKDLAAIAGLPDQVPANLVGELETTTESLDWEAVYEQLLLQSPELSVARAIVCEKAALIQRQQVQAIPNLTGQLGAGYDNGTNSGMINVQVSAPIPVSNRNCGNISAAQAAHQQALENVRRMEQSIKARLARVAQDYESSLTSVNKYEDEIIPQSAEGLELSETAYKAGELDFLQVLILRRSYFESMIQCIEAKSQLAQADAKIKGLLLTGGLDAPLDFTDGDGLRGASFGGQ